MVNLSISILINDVDSGKDVVLYKESYQEYDIENLENHILKIIDSASRKISEGGKLNSFAPQISVSLTTDGELVRPAFHLSKKLIERLAEIEASFDFDPYV